MLKWTSGSEYFLSFEKKKFADTIYIPVQEQSLDPFAAHARRGVINDYLFCSQAIQNNLLIHLLLSHLIGQFKL